MSWRRSKRTMGILLITIGLIGLIISLTLFSAWGYSLWPKAIGPMMWGNMMHGLNNGELKVVNGTVDKVEWMEMELDVNGEGVEVHGPRWFWQGIGIKEGDLVTGKGVFVSMMQPGEGWHQELVPFELIANGKTHGNANNRIPVWMQE